LRIEDEFIVGSRRAVESLALAVDELAAIVPKEARIERAVRRGHFRPDEDPLDLAVDGRGFDPVAVCGAPTCPESLIEGEGARDAIRRSYR
jgi:hypothetical protein